MSSENIDQFRVKYQAGKAAFEGGDYRQAVQHLEAASALIASHSRKGGEIQMWLVTAYDAAGLRSDAIALCKQLGRHPDLETRKQSKRLLYILEAPQLTKRPEWLTQIPDLAALPDSDPKFRAGSTAANGNRSQKQRFEPEDRDLSQVNTNDNRFIWVALITASLVLGGLVWWNF